MCAVHIEAAVNAREHAKTAIRTLNTRGFFRSGVPGTPSSTPSSSDIFGPAGAVRSSTPCGSASNFRCSFLLRRNSVPAPWNTPAKSVRTPTSSVTTIANIFRFISPPVLSGIPISCIFFLFRFISAQHANFLIVSNRHEKIFSEGRASAQWRTSKKRRRALCARRRFSKRSNTLNPAPSPCPGCPAGSPW